MRSCYCRSADARMRMQNALLLGSARFCSLPPHLVPLAAEHVHFIPKDSYEQRFFVMFMLYLPFHHIFFCAFRLFLFFPLWEWNTSWVEDKHTLLLAFHSSHLSSFVCAAAQWVVFGVIACVIQILFCFRVLIDMVGFYFQQEAICVSIDELTLGPVLGLKLIVLKIVHQYFADIENRHPNINRLVEFHTLFVHSETGEIIEK